MLGIGDYVTKPKRQSCRDLHQLWTGHPLGKGVPGHRFGALPATIRHLKSIPACGLPAPFTNVPIANDALPTQGRAWTVVPIDAHSYMAAALWSACLTQPPDRK